MNRKTFLLLMSSAFFVSACSDKGDTGTSTDEVQTIGSNAENAEEITLWTFAPQHIDLYGDAAGRWNEEFPDRPIDLIAETYPFEQMHNNLLLAVQSGTGLPDIVDIELGQYPNFMEGIIQFEPMNEYVEPILDSVVESRYELYARDGNYYGIPTHVGATVMYYNTDIMDEAGVDIDEIVTWDDFVEAGKQVVENTDSTMWNVGTEDWLMDMWPMISQRDSDAIDENGEIIFNNEENVDTLQFLYDALYEDEIAELTPGGMNQSEEFYGYFLDEGSAAILAPLWYMGRFVDNMPDLEGKIAIRPMPAWEEGGNRSAGMGGTGTVVTQEANNVELSKEFLAYAKMSEEGNVNLWTILGFDPPRFDTWESDEVRDTDNVYYEYFGDNIFDVLLDVRDEINTLHVTTDTPNVINEYHTHVTFNVLRNRTETPQEALDRSAEVVKSLQRK